MYSARVVVYTTYCALQIVRLTLHYVTMWLRILAILAMSWVRVTGIIIAV